MRKGLHWLAALLTALDLLPLWLDGGYIAARPVGAPPPTSVEWWPANPQWGNYARAV